MVGMLELMAAEMLIDESNGIKFEVHGKPEPRGSKRAFLINGHVRITDANKNSAGWMQDVARAAIRAVIEAGKHKPVFAGPVALVVEFTLKRPKSHYRADGTLKPGAPLPHTVKPDATKLLRGIEDAMAGIMWHDDAQVAAQSVLKGYGDTPGAAVFVYPIKEVK